MSDLDNYCPHLADLDRPVCRDCEADAPHHKAAEYRMIILGLATLLREAEAPLVATPGTLILRARIHVALAVVAKVVPS